MKKIWIAALLISFTAATVQASELRYQPVNPSFGGFPGNADGLMRSAEAQKDTDDSLSDAREDFGSQVTRYLLSNIASNISEAILGEDAAASGIFTVEGTTIEFTNNGTVVDIIITNASGSTQLQIPAPTF